MITKANFILVATVADGKYVFEYEVPEMMEALEKFWHEDYDEVLVGLKGSEYFPVDVIFMDNGRWDMTLKLGFNAGLFHYYFDHGRQTRDEFMHGMVADRAEMDGHAKFKNDATSLLFYMWNRWCLEECKIVFKGGDWNHFWNKWCGYNSEYGRFGAVEDFYASLTNDNRDKLVRRACEMYDGSREKY